METSIFTDRREVRPVWAKYLIEANEITKKSNDLKLNAAAHAQLIEGTFPILEVHQQKKVVRVFISSTFTDTELERNLLMVDVFPYLTQLCRLFGVQFEVVDMRWGVREFTNDDHGTYNLCMSELHKCRRESLGPAFFCLLGDKYGFRPFPNTIEKEELEAMWEQLKQSELAKVEKALPDMAAEIKKIVTSVPLDSLWNSLDRKLQEELEAHNLLLVPKWFKLDSNNNPAIYVLQSITTYLPEFRSEDKAKRQAAGNKWWTIFEDLQMQLRLGSSALAEAERNKYFISVTEAEVHNGILLNEKRDSQSFCCRRQISDAANFPSEILSRGKFVDIANSVVDTVAHDMLGSLKKEVESLLDSKNLCGYEVSPTLVASPTDSELPLQQQILREFADTFCEKIVQAIFDGYMSKSINMTPLEQELIQQYYFHENKSANLIDRPDITSSLLSYLTSDAKIPHCLVGESGSGKTSIMALMAQKIKAKQPNAFVVYRFIGITPSSSGARQLLQSLYTQISQLLVKRNKNDEDEEEDSEPEVPADFSVLVRDFSALLHKTKEENPLYIFLDSLDQLSNEDSGHSLRWLPWELPDYVHLVVSVLNTQKIYETIKLHKSMSDECFTYVSHITTADAIPIMKSLLSLKGRRISEAQQQIAEKAFQECPLPLYVKVASDIMSKWPSYIPPELCRLEENLPNLISQSVLRTLELVHGEKLVSHALGLISAAKEGLSSKELEDILSCTEEILCDVYQWWKPPLRVLPPMLWKRIRDDLGGYLIERGSSGAIVYRWYHRQFWEAAENRYLKNEKGDGVSQREARHIDLANYFDGKWSSPNKVPYIDESGKQAACDRLISKQPLQFSPTVFNLRKLNELPYHHTMSNIPSSYTTSLFNFDFIAAKCAAKLHHELVQDYQFALQNIDGAKNSEYVARLTYFLEFVEKDLHILNRFPHQALQLALNSPDVLKITAEAKEQAIHATRPFINWVNKSQDIDPCIKTYVNSEQVTNFSVAQDESAIALINESSTRISVVNLNTCAEITKFTAKGGAVKCVKLFENGKKLLAGTARSMEMWDVSSNEVIFNQQTGYVAAIDISPDGSWVISAGDELAVWSVDKKEILVKLDDGESSDSTNQKATLVERAYSHCLISPLGDVVVTVRIETENVAIWDATNFQLRGKIAGVHSTKNSPCSISFSSNGKYLITTSIDAAKGKCVIWDVHSRTQIKAVTAKFGAEFGCLASDEKRLLVAEGQLLKIYDADTGKDICTYQGHRGEVSGVKFLQGGKFLVSAAMDKTVKVWDTSVQQVASTDYRAEEGNVRACVIAPDGASFAYASPLMEGFVKIGKFGTKPTPRSFKIWPQKSQIYSLVYSPYGILASHKGVARLIDPLNGKIKGEYKCQGIIRANISPDGKLIGCATNSTPNSFHLFDAASAKEISSSSKPFFGNHKHATDCCIFSPDGTRIATGGQHLNIIDLSPPYNQIEVADSWHTQFVESCAFSPDGTLLAAEAELVKKVRMWKTTAKGEQKHHFAIWDTSGIKFMHEVRGSIKTVKFLSQHYIFVLEQHGIWLFDLRSVPLSPLATFLRPSSARFSSGDMFGNLIVAFDEMGTVYYFTVSNFSVTN